MIVPELRQMVGNITSVYTGNCRLFFWGELCVGLLTNNKFYMSQRGENLLSYIEERNINQAYGFWETLSEDDFHLKLELTYE